MINTHGRCRFLSLAPLIALLCVTVFGQRPHTLMGDIRLHKSFHSKILKNDRDVIVYLPPGYDKDKKKRYSVFYMHDGQNLFDGATSFIPGQEWRVERAWAARLEQILEFLFPRRM